MKLKKLLAMAEIWFDTNKRGKKKQKKCIKKVLKKLRKLENQLTEKLHRETNPERIEKLEKKLILTHAQRKKGLCILKEIEDKTTDQP